MASEASITPAGHKHLDQIRRAQDRHTATLATAAKAEKRLYDAVAAARAAGMPWAPIAATLGVSTQAVQQRFTKPPRS